MNADLLALNRYVFGRTRQRLDGLTDAEYTWEPVPTCWSIRAGDDGLWEADGPLTPDGALTTGFGPFTTIAWRMWHLTQCYGSPRNAAWLGVPGPAPGDLAPASTAALAVAKLEGAADWWATLLGCMTDADLGHPLGPVAGEFSDSSRFGFLLHMLDEQIHHGAEIGVLRDLYFSSATSGRFSMSTPGAGDA
jgi:DinB superfamily